ncbi:MAG: hypothetical protein ACREVL_02965, partial [Solimonas sp.]
PEHAQHENPRHLSPLFCSSHPDSMNPPHGAAALSRAAPPDIVMPPPQARTPYACSRSAGGGMRQKTVAQITTISHKFHANSIERNMKFP